MRHKASTKKSYQTRVTAVLAYIHKYCADPQVRFTLDDLAKIACLSNYHFSRVFKDITGESVHQYVKRRRLECAAENLHNSDVSIKSIARSAKYQTLPSFTRAFKKHFGCSPSEFREKY